MLNSIADVWNNVLQQLKKDLSETTIATWFDELEAVEIQGNVFVLYCPNDFKKGYIESLFLKNIKAVLRDIFSMDFDVRIIGERANEGENNRQNDRFSTAEFTFEAFVVGPSIKFSHSTLLPPGLCPARPRGRCHLQLTSAFPPQNHPRWPVHHPASAGHCRRPWRYQACRRPCRRRWRRHSSPGRRP